MEKIKNILSGFGIDQVGYVNASSFDYIYKHLMPDSPVSGAFVFLIPYKFTPAYGKSERVSKYARARDYHYFSKELYSVAVPLLEEAYPGYRFQGFCDTSPINEKTAAAKAGLGVIGRNSLLINDKYGSYCFIGSFLTDYTPEHEKHDIQYCLQCMRCVEVCPAQALSGNYPDASICLSAVSQAKKKDAFQLKMLKENDIVWGCDKCQDVCPMNKNAADTPIEFFKEDIISDVTYKMISEMPDDEFRKRAFSWRGKKTLLENITNIDKDSDISID